MGYVLPSFGLFYSKIGCALAIEASFIALGLHYLSVHIATSLGRNARIAPLLADDMHSKIVTKSGKANL